jgi:hypothetical protein
MELIDEIFKKDYYVKNLLRVLNELKMNDGTPIESFDDKKLIGMWNEFWLSLPDSPSIRVHPFFKLCYLCEMIFEDPIVLSLRNDFNDGK